MADETSSTSAAVEATTPKKTPKKGTASAAKTKIVRPKASHPSTAVMVNSAIQNLKERGGSSLQAIKKYMSSTYKVDAEKLAPFIKKYIKASVVSGALVQTKGKGASGSFKLAGTAPKPKATKSPSSPKVKKVVAKKPAAKKPAPVKKAKAAKPEKATVAPPASSPKKASPIKKAAKPKKSPVKKAVSPKPKSPAKAKKAAKSPVKKPPSPKAKTTKPKAAAKAKKASPKKK